MIPELHRKLPEPLFRRGLEVYSRAFTTRCLRKYGVPESDDVVVDVGAMVGEFTIPASHRASLVLALEPDQRNRERLERFSGNVWNVTTFPCAAWNENEMIPFHVNHDPSESVYSPDDPEAVLVRGRRLDSFPWWSRVTFCKIDAEGYEDRVVAGFGDHQPGYVVVDVSEEHPVSREHPVSTVTMQLLGMGYELERDGQVLKGVLTDDP